MRAAVAGLALILALGQAPAALAQADDGSCRNGMFAEENDSFGLARIIGKDKARFHGDMDGCPMLSAACLQTTYVVPGDRVVTGRSKGAFTCVYFPNKVGGTAGWMLSTRLAALPIDPHPQLTNWLGRWNHYDNSVRFTRQGRGLRVDGNAYWPSANPSPKQRPGGPNLGQIGGAVTVNGNLAFESECKVSFHLLGPIVIVADPARACGGMNVAFTGVYLRQRR